jgi:hypothetical protein
MASNHRITVRLPRDEVARVKGILRAHNEGRRSKERLSFNDWLVAASRSTAGIDIKRMEVVPMPPAKKIEAEPPAPIIIKEPFAPPKPKFYTGDPPPWLDESAVEKIKNARTPADLAAAIPGLQVGIIEPDEEGW